MKPFLLEQNNDDDDDSDDDENTDNNADSDADRLSDTWYTQINISWTMAPHAGCGKVKSPLKLSAIFLAIVPNFEVKFYMFAVYYLFI